MASSDPPPGGDRDVFSGLPHARPQRRSAKRDRSRGGVKAQTGGPPAAKAGAGAETKPRRQTRAAPRKAPPQARAAASTKPAAAASGKARSQAPPIPPAGYATPGDDDRPRGTDLIGTAVQAAGELAQIGIAAGGRALKSAIQRLPRP